MTRTPTPIGALRDTPFAFGPNGELCCEGTPLSAVAHDFGTPTYVYSERAIVQAYQSFAHASQHRRVQICYALKANPNIAIISLLAKLGAGFDIVSAGELQRVLAAGGRADRVVFSGVGKRRDEIQQALQAGVKCINVESEAELHRISEVAQSCNTDAPISLRVNPNIDAKTHPYISTGLKENKFGVPIEDALELYRLATRLPGITVCGLDCHIGSQITELQPFLDALDAVLALTQRLHEAGIAIDHLDLGGGLGICYDQETPPPPQMFMEHVLARLDQWSARTGQALPEILFEFGRAIVGNAGLLLSTVELLKPGPFKNFAVIDAAMNDLMRPSLYDAWHNVVPVVPQASAPLKWDLVGPVCESGDWIAKDRQIALAPGQLLAILSAGAYGMSMSSHYNSRPRAAEVLIDNEGRPHLIRRRERIEELYAQERIPVHMRTSDQTP